MAAQKRNRKANSKGSNRTATVDFPHEGGSSTTSPKLKGGRLQCPLLLNKENKIAASLLQAEKLYQDVKVIAAYRLLRSMNLRNNRAADKLGHEHRAIYNRGKMCEESVQDLLNPPNSRPEDGWIKQGESCGSFPTEIYYKVDSKVRLTCRVETPIEQTLLVPLLSVLNESELYKDWFPSSTSPKMGLLQSKALARYGRADQVLQVTTAAPWPFSNREVVLKTVVFDDIDHNGLFGVLLGTAASGGVVPPTDAGVKRVGFEGMLLFRPCPDDHPTLASNTPGSRAEPKILVTFKMWCDPELTGVPTSAINYTTRSFIGEVWNMFLTVAEGVRNGEQPRHLEAVQNRPELYSFVKERVEYMLGSLNSNIEELEGYEDEKAFLVYLQC